MRRRAVPGGKGRIEEGIKGGSSLSALLF